MDRAAVEESVAHDYDEDLHRLLRRQDNVLTHAQACGQLSRSAVRHRVEYGRWQRPWPGVLVAHSGPLSGAQWQWIALLSAGRGAVLGGLSAARAGGLRDTSDRRTHILLTGTSCPRHVPRFVRMHRTRLRFDLLDRARPPRTGMARALVDAAAWARTDDDARAILARGFQQRLVVAGDLERVLCRMPRVRRRALITETTALAADGAHAITELDLRRICRRYRLPAPEHQVRRADRSGRVRYLDAHWRPWRLHVEVDGFWHTEVATWWADMRRQNDLWVAGERVLRFPGWALRHDAATVARQIRTALTAAGWRTNAA